MSGLNDDQRLNDILEMIGRVAALDFSETLSISEKNDMIDAIALGLNMLSEELQSNVVEKSKLDEVNSKLKKFAYTTAHDLKSPLNSITGLLNLIEIATKPEKGSDTYLYVEAMKKTTEKMKGLVHGVLEYSLTDTASIEKTNIDLNTLIQEIIESDQLDQEAKIVFDNHLPIVPIYKPSIEQVIRNLLNNAIKYSDKEICKINIGSRDKDDHTEVYIADNGRGIAQNHQEEIFNLFNRIDRDSNKESQGIGLATVKNILENFGEKIWVKSTLGDGATFYFTLKHAN